MNIAFVSTILACPWGGADKLWTRAAEAAAETGHSVLIAVSPAVAEHPRMTRMAERGVQFLHRLQSTQPRGGRQQIAEQLAAWSRRATSIYARLDAFRPDHVFLCQGGTYDFMVEPGLLNWLRRAAVPFSVICQSNSDTSDTTEHMRTVAREVFGQARAVFFVSTHNRELAERQIAATIAGARIVQNPVELRTGSVSWPGGESAQFAVVARLDAHHKGLDVLMCALGMGLLDVPSWQVNLYGRGPDEPYLRELAARSGVADHVRFHGFVADVSQIWAANHMLLMPSRYQGCALAMLEALACGRPVLTTDVGGTSDWIEDGQNGFVCAAAVPSLVGATLRTAMTAKNHWEEMGRRAAVSARKLTDTPETALLSVLN